ncbi:MAG: hypothetical protein EBU72_13895, partial [Betaproteobacteria bacterium]|nr:hypothetical protein [Betaproteobacteria bacterium]
IAGVIAATPGAGSGLTGGNLTHSGNGTLVLSGANTFAGAVNVTNDGATLVVRNAAALGAGAAVNAIAGSTLRFDIAAAPLTLAKTLTVGVAAGKVLSLDQGGSDLALTGGLAGAGDLTQTTSGKLSLGGTSTYAGKLRLAAGSTLELTSAGALNGAAAADSLTFTGSGTLRYAALPGVTSDASVVLAPLAAGSTLTLDTGAFAVGFAQTIRSTQVDDGQGNLVADDTATFVKTGSGALTLGLLDAPAGKFAGTFRLDQGTLVLADQMGSALPFKSLVIGGDATIRFDAGIDISDKLAPLAAGKTLTLDLTNTGVTFASGLAGAGAIVKVGDFNLNLGGVSTLTAGSTVAVTAGTLTLSGDGTLGGATLTVAGGEFVNASSAGSIANAIQFGATARFSGGGADFTGPVTLLANSAVTFDGNTTFSGAIGGAKSLTIKGGSYSQVILSGTNTYSGGTTIQGTTVTAGSLGAFGSGAILVTTGTTGGYYPAPTSGTLDLAGLTLANPITLAGGTIQDFGGSNGSTGSVLTSLLTAQSGLISAAIAGTDFVKSGAGELILSGINVYTGATTVNG